ncbi:MAG: MipA/OmpV family protein [Parvibaculales bacterium]
MKHVSAALAALCVWAAAGGAQADVLDEPLWEAGIGGGGFSGPTYPGSDDQTTQGLFVPFIIYRGEVFSIGEESGARALAFANETVELDVSIGASLAADASEDADREGMPDLDFLFEIGPQVIFHAARHDFAAWTGHFDIKLRTRAVIATDFASFEDQGFLLEPAFVYELKSKRNRLHEFQFDIELLYGSERLNEYFYDVDPRYVDMTMGRSEYQAEQGYIGTELGISMSLPVNDQLRIFAGMDVEFYDGAANQDSPLFKKDNAISGGIGLVYTFFESTERVKRR